MQIAANIRIPSNGTAPFKSLEGGHVEEEEENPQQTPTVLFKRQRLSPNWQAVTFYSTTVLLLKPEAKFWSKRTMDRVGLASSQYVKCYFYTALERHRLGKCTPRGKVIIHHKQERGSQ